MKALDNYLKIFNKLTRKAKLQARAQLKENTLIINEVIFMQASKEQFYSDSDPKKGFLISSLTEDERRFCMNQRINYLTLNGQFQLVSDQTVLTITYEKKPRKKTSLSKATSAKGIRPTLLFSPYSLSILDILFRVSDTELILAPSALSFSKKFNLYQPKLSKLMRELEAKSLTILKQKIANLPEDWWLLAFQYPATKKRLTPFFEVAKPFHTIEARPASEREFNAAILNSQGRLIPGPVEIAKQHGIINDNDHYLWVSKNTLQDLKHQHRLVPGRAPSGPTWHLAVPNQDFHKEAIVSNLKQENTHPIDLANSFRAIWDLSFGSERLKEVRMPLLWRLLE